METTPKCKPAMSLSALGATLAMVPLPFIILLAMLEIYRPSDDVANMMGALQVIGCILWSIGQFKAADILKRFGARSGAFTAIAIVVAVAAILEAIVFFGGDEIKYKLSRSIDRPRDIALIFYGVYLIIHITLWISTNKIASLFNRITPAVWGYALLTIVPVFLTVYAMSVKDSGFDAYQTFMTVLKISGGALELAIVLCVIGWWRAVDSAFELDNSIDDEPEISVVTAGVATQPNRSPIPLTDEQKRQLMSMDDAHLQEIVNNPSLFANPMYVGEAGNILQKRRAWEAINTKSDDELMAIMTAPEGQYDNPTLDAVSMELSARETPMFVSIIESYSTADLQNMVNDPGNYFDGYVVYARKVLDKRINNQ